MNLKQWIGRDTGNVDWPDWDISFDSWTDRPPTTGDARRVIGIWEQRFRFGAPSVGVAAFFDGAVVACNATWAKNVGRSPDHRAVFGSGRANISWWEAE